VAAKPRLVDDQKGLYNPIYWLVGGLEQFLFSHISGISSSQLTRLIFFRGVEAQAPTSKGFPSYIVDDFIIQERGIPIPSGKLT